MNTKSRTSIGIALCRLNSDSAAAFQLFPAGRFRATDGRPKDCEGWIVDDPAALVAQAKAKMNGFVIDYEHQTLAAAQNGQAAPAAGWFEGAALEWRDDGMYVVSAKWTERATAYLKADEYRYISPVFRYDTKTGKVLELLSVALTNTPALDGMQAVVAAASQLINPQDTGMDLLSTLIQELELPEGTAEDKVIEAVKQLKQAAADAAAAAAKDKPVVKPDAPAACKTSDPIALSLATENIALKAQIEAGERDRLIAANTAKLYSPAMIAWAKTQDIASLKSFLAATPELAALTQSQTGGATPPPANQAGELNEEEIAMCKSMNVSIDSYKAAKAQRTK
ncbi:MAG: phage protease [Thiotrichaceae bacterium]|nr:phage protease [Thiotrichaceae bacterium]